MEVLSFYCSDLFTKCDVIAKFLGPIYQGLTEQSEYRSWPVIQGKSNRTLALPIYAAKMSSSSVQFDRHAPVVVTLLILLVVHLWSQIQTK